MLSILNPFSGTDHCDRLIYGWTGSGAPGANIFRSTTGQEWNVFSAYIPCTCGYKEWEAYRDFQRKQHGS